MYCYFYPKSGERNSMFFRTNGWYFESNLVMVLNVRQNTVRILRILLIDRIIREMHIQLKNKKKKKNC